jgi:hypothetical protein
MNTKKRPWFLCLILCVSLLVAHFNAITSYAAPLGIKDSVRIINAIQSTEQGKFFSNLTNGPTVYIRSFTITNLAAPVHGTLLDDTATVVADNGVSWDIPVIWVDQDGNVVHIAIEISETIRSYPVFVFYMPQGYSMIFGEKATYNIGMPDFVVSLMKRNGVTALSIPETGRTYISALLPNSNGFKMNVASETPSEIGGDGKEAEPDSGGAPSGGKGSRLTPPTDNKTSPPDPDLTDEEKVQLTDAHCDQNVISKVGIDNLAALITWVKDTLEPEAANLLAEKFPAYKEAAKDGELGDSLGLYIYYDTYYDEDGSATDKSNLLASVNWNWDSQGAVDYRLCINASYFYDIDPETGEAVFDPETKYTILDNTLVHEMMHAYMVDYTRTGMTGLQHDTTTTPDSYIWSNDDVAFPKWFLEGMAASVDSTFQFRYNSIHNNYGFDGEQFVAEDLQQSYADSSNLQITADSVESKYITGYLACIYLGYLAAKSQNKDAVSGTRVNSSSILYGENYILEKLHNGSTLDEIIAEISTDSDGKPLYNNTDEFEQGFISDGGSSLEFCATLLNYLQSNSSDDSTANGSILLDFADTNTAQLRLSLLKNGQKVYVLSDSKEFVESSIDKDKALISGGRSEIGIITGSDEEQTEDENDQDTGGKEPSAEEKDQDAEMEETTAGEDALPTEETDQDAIEAETPVSSITDAILVAINSEDVQNESDDTDETDIPDSEDELINDLEEQPESQPLAEDTEAPATETAVEPTSESSPAPEQNPVTDDTTAVNAEETEPDSNESDVIADTTSEDGTGVTSPMAYEDAISEDNTAEQPEGTIVEEESATPAPEDSVEVTIAQEPEAPEANGFIISEAEPEDDSDNNEDPGSEQILDAMPEPPSNDDDSNNNGKTVTE